MRDQDDENPITLTQLGEFLFRCARIKKVAEEAGVCWKPTPGGGALHEIEIYPLIDNCAGLDKGLYHYRALDHELVKVAEPNPEMETLSNILAITGTLERPSQVAFVLAARFQRVQFKYQSMGYAVMLKNLGALYQTMYLVATAMKLAPCGLGGGHADLFAKITGLDYLEESSIGEFMLGSLVKAPIDGK